MTYILNESWKKKKKEEKEEEVRKVLYKLLLTRAKKVTLLQTVQDILITIYIC
jgi:hypothetical protein